MDYGPVFNQVPFKLWLQTTLLFQPNKKEWVSQAIPKEEKSALYQDDFSGLQNAGMISNTEQSESPLCDNMGGLNVRGPALSDTVNLAVRHDIA